MVKNVAKCNRSATLVITVLLILCSTSTVDAQQLTAVNRSLVELETAGSGGISVRIAENLARLVGDGASRRALPVLGETLLQNIIDIKYLRGMYLELVQGDLLEYVKQQKIIPRLKSTTCITEVYNEECHLVGRPKIETIADLADKRINVDLLGAGTAIMAGRLFDQLELDIIVTHDSQQWRSTNCATVKLRRSRL